MCPRGKTVAHKGRHTAKGSPKLIDHDRQNDHVVNLAASQANDQSSSTFIDGLGFKSTMAMASSLEGEAIRAMRGNWVVAKKIFAII